MNTCTPDTISLPVADLCRRINPDARPQYVTITPEPGCEVDDCFRCIRRKVARQGGRIQFGWSIWEWPRVYVEAEHHAVYEPRTGPPWIDITPSARPEIRRRLFVPDATASYDFENEGIRRDNIRLALADDPLVRSFFRLAEERSAIMNAIPGIGVVTLEGESALRYQRSLQEQAVLEFQLGMKYTPQGAPCFCGSGRKFKRCHGKPLIGRQ